MGKMQAVNKQLFQPVLKGDRSNIAAPSFYASAVSQEPPTKCILQQDARHKFTGRAANAHDDLAARLPSNPHPGRHPSSHARFYCPPAPCSLLPQAPLPLASCSPPPPPSSPPQSLQLQSIDSHILRADIRMNPLEKDATGARKCHS